ncbi:unnamed protein product [Urochloa humidicola]
MASAMPLALLLLFLLVTHTQGSRRVLFRSTDYAGASPRSNAACPSIASGHSNGNKLPLVHRLSPCSSLGGSYVVRKRGKAALADILHRDGLRMRSLSDVKASNLTVPATTNVVIGSFPGVFSYTALAGYGTPAQQVPVYFDVSGQSNLHCKPCSSGSATGAGTCDGAFDSSRSSTFGNVPCGSPDCAVEVEPQTSSCASGGSCTFTFRNSTFLYGNGTVVKDTLTLSPSATFEDFFVGCLQVDNEFFIDGVAIGNIDLSRHHHSVATRALLSSQPGTAAFSYCLPADTDTHGFLAIAPSMSDYSSLAGVKYLPLVTKPSDRWYYVDLVAIAVDGKDLPFTPAEFRGNGTFIDNLVDFSYLSPPIYTALRDEFRSAMAKYQPAPAFKYLDTCYNFTGLNYIELPDITLKFGNGETMELDDRQFMYFFREHLDDGFPFGCLAFAAYPTFGYNWLGTQIQRTKEIVFDIRGGQVAVVPSRCGLR